MTDIRSLKTDTDYLLNEQYKTDSNLAARARLHRDFSTNKYGWQRWLFDWFDGPPNAHVNEFGSGPGWLWVENLARIPAGGDITLSDFSVGMIEASQQNLAQGQRPFKLEVIDIQAIPYPDAVFDIVTANHMLYHVPDLNKAISEMRRILKPDGKLYTATNGVRHLIELYELQQRFDSTVDYWQGFSAARSFELDNAVQILSAFFPHVDRHRYEDALVVTEDAPLIDYMLSGRSKTTITGDKLEALRAFVRHEIATHGGIHISKDAGLLISSAS